MGKLNKKEADLYMLFRREALNLRDEFSNQIKELRSEVESLKQKKERRYKPACLKCPSFEKCPHKIRIR